MLLLPPHSLLLLCMMHVIPQVLQLTKQSAESTLPMTQSVRSRGGYVAVESYGNWGKEAENTFARLASILSISLHCPKAKVLTEIYGQLNISLVRSVAGQSCPEDVFQVKIINNSAGLELNCRPTCSTCMKLLGL